MSSLVEANNGLSADALSAAARMRTEAFRVFILVGAERFWLRGPGRPPRPADCGVWREPLPSPLTTDSPARYHRQGAIFRQNPVRGPRIWSRIVRPALEPGPPGSVRRRAIRTAAAGHCARRAWRPGPPPGGPRRRWRACHLCGMEGYQGEEQVLAQPPAQALQRDGEGVRVHAEPLGLLGNRFLAGVAPNVGTQLGEEDAPVALLIFLAQRVDGMADHVERVVAVERLLGGEVRIRRLAGQALPRRPGRRPHRGPAP